MADPESPRILVAKGRCPINASLESLFASYSVDIIGLGQELPPAFHDLEIIETHLSGEEWARLWRRDREANQRVHVCLAQPISAIICRNMLEEYRRRRK